MQLKCNFKTIFLSFKVFFKFGIALLVDLFFYSSVKKLDFRNIFTTLIFFIIYKLAQ